jgi:hypothetical protein
MSGGCHCGAVRFRIRVRSFDAIDCNCSICTMKGFLHLIVAGSDFELLRGEDAMSVYRFNTGTATHRFCRTCGIHAFYQPRSHPGSFDVNVRCLDDAPLPRFALKKFDGRHWEDNIATIR